MKKYVIDEEMCEKSHLKLNHIFAILLLNTGKTYEETINELLEREILEKDGLFNDRYLIKHRWANIISDILLNSEIGSIDEVKEYDAKMLELAVKLIEIFPEGKKEGTKLYWKGNKMDIRRKLKKFFKLYGKYSDEEIINATKAYVAMHNGGDTTMRILKYFILKDDESDLASMLENAGQNDSKNDIGELV